MPDPSDAAQGMSPEEMWRLLSPNKQKQDLLKEQMAMSQALRKAPKAQAYSLAGGLLQGVPDAMGQIKEHQLRGQENDLLQQNQGDELSTLQALMRQHQGGSVSPGDAGESLEPPQKLFDPNSPEEQAKGPPVHLQPADETPVRVDPAGEDTGMTWLINHLRSAAGQPGAAKPQAQTQPQGGLFSLGG